jgi:hypothetical protein
MTAQIDPVQDKYKHMTFRSVHLKKIPYITEVLLKVELNTITLTLTQIEKTQMYPTIPIIELGTHLNK